VGFVRPDAGSGVHERVFMGLGELAICVGRLARHPQYRVGYGGQVTRTDRLVEVTKASATQSGKPASTMLVRN